MSPKSERQFKKIRLQKERLIMQTALKLFAHKGYHTASVSMIAKDAGISKGLMYNYFNSKEDLLKRIVIEGLYEFASVLHIDDNELLKKEELLEFIDKNVEALKENSGYFRLYFSLFFQPGVFEIIKDEAKIYFEGIINKITDYYKEKGWENSYLKTRFLLAVLDGVGIHYLSDTENFLIDEVRKILLKQI
jgi:AcrR family transcriptional regulator